MFELGRRGSIRKIKYLECVDVRKIATPAITEIIKIAKANTDEVSFGALSWYAQAIQCITKRAVNRKESLNIIATAFGFESHWDMVKKTSKGKCVRNKDYDPNEHYISIYVNAEGKNTHVGITYYTPNS